VVSPQDNIVIDDHLTDHCREAEAVCAGVYQGREAAFVLRGISKIRSAELAMVCWSPWLTGRGADNIPAERPG